LSKNDKISNSHDFDNQEDASFTYKVSNDNFKLSIPKFEVKPGEVVGIAGKVGSGKSSVINVILGHMETETGKVNVGESVAYVRQNPWLQNLSIKKNILFGEKFEENKYRRIVHACALELDFQILANGNHLKH
jgi:ATP-binding cassette, subfamily C (CFTR/MRP), member 1